MSFNFQYHFLTTWWGIFGTLSRSVTAGGSV